MKKICVVTGSRADYGLLYWLIQRIHSEPGLELQLIVTGSHLSPEFGLTYLEIEESFLIDKKIEIVLSADTTTAINKSMGLALISFGEAYQELKPDLLIILGDRYETLAAATAATVSRIPIAHLHGGELSYGAIDESFRHAITKMSHLHFTATESYRQRVIQLGEHPERVFCTGALGLENINRLELLSKDALEKVLSFNFLPTNLLITYHPVTQENNSSEAQFKKLLSALSDLTNTGLIFTKSNSDTHGRIINQLIDDYVQTNSKNAIAFKSMGQLNYLSTLQYVDAVLGNSSSAIIEVPSFKIPSINIGERQDGRIKPASVIDCSNESSDIFKAIQKALSSPFKEEVLKTTNPYDHGSASEKICSILKTIDFNVLPKKVFYDLRAPMPS